MTDVDQVIAEMRSLATPQEGLEGIDPEKLIEKLKQLIERLDLNGAAIASLHALYHYVVDELVPKLLEITPNYIDAIITGILLPFLKKIHDAYFPHS